jgi:hypothetical protein
VDSPLPLATYAQAMRLAEDKARAKGLAEDDRATASGGTDAVFRIAAAGFAAARDALAGLRDDITFEDSPAPRRLAPYSAAMAAVACRDDEEVASGRLILLYDPDGQDGWTGVFRIVAYVRADMDEEIAADPLLGEVGWSWLTDALDTHAPGYTAPSGTVTRVVTEAFGAKEDEPPTTEFELRASWSPPEDTDLGVNVAAWWDLLAAAAGLPAQPPGTTALHPGSPRPGGKPRR